MIADFDSPAIFDVAIRGGSGAIILNASHPHIAELLQRKIVIAASPHVEVDPLWESWLTALASLELEAPTAAARQRLVEHRADLGRRLRSAKR
jgi:hypothetical protein